MVDCDTVGGTAIRVFERGFTVYFWIPLKCQSENLCFSLAAFRKKGTVCENLTVFIQFALIANCIDLSMCFNA